MKKLKLSQSNFAGAEVLNRAELKKVMGGFFNDQDGSGGSCGTNTYDTHGSKVGETRGIKKSAAIDAASQANAEHASYCTPQCKYITKWCCNSC